MNKGFTLIELLVVVLIIGILAAVALPQYTKAVERSRMAEAVQVLGDLATAESIYFMQQNAFASVAAGGTVPGDITFTLPNDNNRWIVAATAAGTNLDESVTATATRKGGMYDGGVLSIKVEPNGKITKGCTTDSNPTGFCEVAKAMGYGNGTAAAI